MPSAPLSPSGFSATGREGLLAPVRAVPPLRSADLAALHLSLGIPADYATVRGLALQSEADEASLVVIGLNADGKEIRLTSPAAAAWAKLRDAAAADRIVLLPVSGFRSVARQAEIIRAHLAAGRSLGAILRFVAAPGFSEHHTARALDLATPGSPPLEETFADTAAFAWLLAHAARFGFVLSFPRHNPHAIGFEPWHWCWQPT